VTADEATREPRAGEGLDAARLGAWLEQALPGYAGPLAIRQFPAGFSNLTYLLATPGRDYILRRPPFGTRPRTGHDMLREYRVLAALGPHFRYCPRVLACCEDESVIGAPFYVAERIRGLILRRDYPPDLAATPQRVRAQQQALVDVQAELHAIDVAAAGLSDLGRAQGYIQRQVEGWTDRYERARTPDAPDASEVAAWLSAEQPADAPVASLIHNDFKLDNVVFDTGQPERLIGVLDWEMATLGDPRMDLGCSLAYWIEADDPPWLRATRMLPTHLPGSLTRAEVVARYATSRGLSVEPLPFFQAFGLFRLAVVAQQIYLRYVQGYSRDERFAALGPAAQALLRAAGVIASGRPLGAA
jgi:aminoglycoside phosphotransferase (APT) family kinase protein